MHADASRQTAWVKSSFSGTTSANCVEIRIIETVVLVRDSKNPHGPRVHFESAAWNSFLDDAASR
jgi:hypothetical protein